MRRGSTCAWTRMRSVYKDAQGAADYTWASWAKRRSTLPRATRVSGHARAMAKRLPASASRISANRFRKCSISCKPVATEATETLKELQTTAQQSEPDHGRKLAAQHGLGADADVCREPDQHDGARQLPLARAEESKIAEPEKISTDISSNDNIHDHAAKFPRFVRQAEDSPISASWGRT